MLLAHSFTPPKTVVCLTPLWALIKYIPLVIYGAPPRRPCRKISRFIGILSPKTCKMSSWWFFDSITSWSVWKVDPNNIHILIICVHPGRLTAGTYKSPIFKRKENDLNQTSRELCSMLIFRGVNSLGFLETCPLPLFHQRNHQETMCDVLKSEPKLMPWMRGKMGKNTMDTGGLPRWQTNTLQGINISHLGKWKIIFKMPFLGDMLVSWRVFESNLAMRKSLSWWIYSYQIGSHSHSRKFTTVYQKNDGKNGIREKPSRTNSYFEEMVTSQHPNNLGETMDPTSADS